MNIALWIAQVILAGMFGMAGVMKTISPVEKLKERMPWAERFEPATIRFIGVSEFLGAVGIILPTILGILPLLVSLSATGLALTQVLAAIHHAQHKEYKGIGFNAVLFALSLFVAIGRF